MVLEHDFGRVIIPLVKWSACASMPGAIAADRSACPLAHLASEPASNEAAASR
jgi:hypothetical protein